MDEEILWVARHQDGNIYGYVNEPVRFKFGGRGIFCDATYPVSRDILLNKKFFPEVTWENSPKKVKLKLV